MKYACDLLEIEDIRLEDYLTDMQIEGKIICTGEAQSEIYLSSLYYMERNTALMLNALNIRAESDETFVQRRIMRIQSEEDIILDDKQADAVKASVNNGVLIITGGPGTGKTTTINTIIKYYEEDNKEIALAAPTGRAAKRMSEATGYEAKTIHRLLEYTGKPDEGEIDKSRQGSKFLRDERNPLEADVVIVDEMSMVDIYLMEALLKAIVPGTRLILVGDANQLPSVGAGNVLKDMIDSGEYKTVCLTHIFRQAALSDIVVNAHK
ncbi:helicase, RecD/TraA family, partial [gut metagenome]